MDSRFSGATPRFASLLKTRDIAGAARIHPNYGMNLFKREFGMILGEFLARTRLYHAQRPLATTNRKVLDIAFSCGFGSPSRLHAAFKAPCGHSPASYRNALPELSSGELGDHIMALAKA